jgi:DNA-binding MarR family transcriptional regulator
VAKHQSAVSAGAKGDARAGATRPQMSVEGTAGEASALGLDRLIHERLRLGIVSALAVNGSMSFTDLKTALNATDGNLSAHARRLEEAGYIVCRKSFDGRIPRTDYELTRQGRRELEAYLDHMEALIRQMRVG